jgi:hypothetical protein
MNIKLDQTHNKFNDLKKNPFTFVVHIILIIRKGPKIKFRNNYIYISIIMLMESIQLW